MGSTKSSRKYSPSRAARKSTVALCMTFAVSVTALSTTGCRITTDDVEGWAKKKAGPRKLVAVVQHDKYDMPLRVTAGMTLVSMKPRGGRAVGLLGDEEYIGLLEGLEEMSADERAPIIKGMVPELVKGITFVPQGDEVDTSFAYKDAAFALLTHGETGLVTDKEVTEKLKAALIEWAKHNFEARMDDTSQLYGMEQVLRYLRAPGVEGLTELIEPDFKKIREVSKLISELGDKETKQEASKKMVTVAKHVDSQAWIKQKAPSVEAANERSGLKVKEKQFEKQLEAYQEEELLRVFGAMKNIGEKPIVDYLLAYAENKENPEKRRAAALAGLENNLDRKNEVHAKAMLDFISSDETPDTMRDVAARRVGELSREQVAERLYGLFDHKRWQLRWTVASLLLKMTEAKQMDEFMEKLGKVKHMAITEPLSYGKLLAEVKGAKPEELSEKYSAKNYPVPVRLSALGYYYEGGTKEDAAKLEKFKNDSQKVPSCPEDAQQCAWTCTIEGKKGPESKEVTTVGEYVTYCILPGLEKRQPEKTKNEDDKGDAKPADKEKKE